LVELKVLPTQPDHPAIPEEEGDDEDAHERVKADDESEGVEVSLYMATLKWRLMISSTRPSVRFRLELLDVMLRN
jgi:hypothetical protein